MRLIKWLVLVCYASLLSATQDDNPLIIREPFPAGGGLAFLHHAQAEADLGYYFIADEYHLWRARVIGDVGFIRASTMTWHTGLAMETLVDNQNDINFRLVQVYYQALTAIDWNLGGQAFSLGYRHRCSHGTDGAIDSRITIRSGPTFTYQKSWQFEHVHLAIEPGLNAYVLGQNSDKRHQYRGEIFFNAQALFPFYGSLSFLAAIGANCAFLTEGDSFFYHVASSVNKWKVTPLFASRVGLRVAQGIMKSDMSLAYRQNLDSSLGRYSKKLHLLSLDINFMW